MRCGSRYHAYEVCVGAVSAPVSTNSAVSTTCKYHELSRKVCEQATCGHGGVGGSRTVNEGRERHGRNWINRCGGRDSRMLALAGEARIGEHMGIKLGLSTSAARSTNRMKMYRFVSGLHIDCKAGVVVEGLPVHVRRGCGSWV